MTLNAPQIVTSEMNITCSWGMQMPHAGSPLMRNHAPLADVNSERSMLGFSAEACLATFWFSNGFAAGFSLNLEEVWDPCAMQGQRHSDIWIFHTTHKLYGKTHYCIWCARTEFKDKDTQS